MKNNGSHDSPGVNRTAFLHEVLNNISLISDKDSLSHEDFYEEFEMVVPAPFTSLYIAWLCIAAILFIPGLLANGMIIYALFKIDRLRVPTNFLIASLAVADLLMMAGMAAFVLSDVLQVQLPDHLSVYLWPSFDIFIGSASILNLAAVSFDRALAVQRPLRYHENLSLSQTYRAIRCIWGYSLLMFVLSLLRCDIRSPAYLKGVLYTAYICSFGVPCLVIMIAYGCILLSTISNLKISRRIEKAIHTAMTNGESKKSSTESRRKRRLRLQEIRIASNIMVILLPFIVGWGFYFGTHFYESIVGQYRRSDLYEWFLIIVPWVNSSVNPVIYIMFTSSLRKACRKLLCRNRYLSRARETALTTLISKRASTIDRRVSQASDEKSSFWDRLSIFSRRSRASFESDFNERTDGNKYEMQVLQKKSKETATYRVSDKDRRL